MHGLMRGAGSPVPHSTYWLFLYWLWICLLCHLVAGHVAIGSSICGSLYHAPRLIMSAARDKMLITPVPPQALRPLSLLEFRRRPEGRRRW